MNKLLKNIITFVVVPVVIALDRYALELLAGLVYGRQAHPGPPNASLARGAGPGGARILAGTAVVLDLTGQLSGALGQASRGVGNPESAAHRDVVLGAVAGQRGQGQLAGAGPSGTSDLALEAVTGIALEEETGTMRHEAALDPAGVQGQAVQVATLLQLTRAAALTYSVAALVIRTGYLGPAADRYQLLRHLTQVAAWKFFQFYPKI